MIKTCARGESTCSRARGSRGWQAAASGIEGRREGRDTCTHTAASAVTARECACASVHDGLRDETLPGPAGSLALGLALLGTHGRAREVLGKSPGRPRR